MAQFHYRLSDESDQDTSTTTHLYKDVHSFIHVNNVEPSGWFHKAVFLCI